MTLDSLGHFDVIVVGAGSAGCTLAARLSEDESRAVALVEAGKDFGVIANYPPPLRNAYLNAFSMPGNPHGWPMMASLTPEMNYPITRGKLVGGSSAVNGALFLRGHRDDYDNWAANGNSEWSYEAVLSSLKSIEADLDFGETNIHGGSGPIPVKRANIDNITPVSSAFLDACAGLGHEWDSDMNRPDSHGVGLVPNNAADGIRHNVAIHYLEPAKHRSNLTVMPETLVNRVVFDNRRAVGVEVTRLGQRRTIEADEVVLSCGALKSPQLLMLSGVGPASELRALGIQVIHDARYVGHNLMDHPGVKLSYRTSKYLPEPGPRAVAEVATNYSVDGVEVRIYPFLYTRMNQLFGVFRGQGFLKSARATASANPLKALRAVWGSSLHALRSEVSEREDLTILCSLGVEESRGRLSIQSTDAAAAPRVDFGYLASPADRGRLRDGLRLTMEIARSNEFSRLEPRFVDLPTAAELTADSLLDKWIARRIGTSYHTAGTCKMGPSTDESAVVDQYGRVYGIEGLRVVDISVMPTITRRPTSASAVMIGEHMARLISADGDHTAHRMPEHFTETS